MPKAALPKWRGVTDVKPRVTRRNVTTRWSHDRFRCTQIEVRIVDLTVEGRANIEAVQIVSPKEPSGGSQRHGRLASG